MVPGKLMTPDASSDSNAKCRVSRMSSRFKSEDCQSVSHIPRIGCGAPHVGTDIPHLLDQSPDSRGKISTIAVPRDDGQVHDQVVRTFEFGSHP